jgi:hypothetical protein
MDVLYLEAIVSGICFGLWPLFMNKSGLNSAEVSAALSLFLLVALPGSSRQGVFFGHLFPTGHAFAVSL